MTIHLTQLDFNGLTYKKFHFEGVRVAVERNNILEGYMYWVIAE